MGYIKHAFILSFFHLLLFHKSEAEDAFGFYELALRQTIELGGDTDTNAAIVGAMVGALVGVHNIPEPMLLKVLQFDCTELRVDKQGNKVGRQRPEFLSVRKHSIENLKQLSMIIPVHKKGTIDVDKMIKNLK